VLADAISGGLSQVRLKNKAGQAVVADSRSVSFALMELGGNLNARGNADLMDASSTYAWPIAGYTYYILRKGATLTPAAVATGGAGEFMQNRMNDGKEVVMFDCVTRGKTLSYLEWFYNSDTSAAIGDVLGRVRQMNKAFAIRRPFFCCRYRCRHRDPNYFSSRDVFTNRCRLLPTYASDPLARIHALARLRSEERGDQDAERQLLPGHRQQPPGAGQGAQGDRDGVHVRLRPRLVYAGRVGWHPSLCRAQYLISVAVNLVDFFLKLVALRGRRLDSILLYPAGEKGSSPLF